MKARLYRLHHDEDHDFQHIKCNDNNHSRYPPYYEPTKLCSTSLYLSVSLVSRILTVTWLLCEKRWSSRCQWDAANAWQEVTA